MRFVRRAYTINMLVARLYYITALIIILKNEYYKKYMILNQWSRRNCWVYWVMAILQHMWVNFSIAEFQDKKAPYIPLIEKLFMESGLVRKFIKIPTIKLVDLWLNRWEYLLTGTNLWDFTLEDNLWWLVEFDWNSQHWFVICEDLWDKWKCQNSWGYDYWDNGYMYMKKSDFSKLFCPRRIICNK